MQGSLTGESFPVEKFEADTGSPERSPIELANLAFLGTSVESGTATAAVVATGRETYLGSMAESLEEQPTETAFDKGVARFTWLMLRFIIVMVPLVFIINGLTKGPLARGLLLRAGRRRGAHPRNAPDDRHGLSLQGRDGDGQEEGHRQENQRHPEPRRHGCALHGQDGHAHAGSRDPGLALRRRPRRRTMACWRWRTSTATSRPA